MDAITPKTRLGFRGGRLVCPECKAEGCQIISLKDAKSRQYPCSMCDKWFPLLSWLLKRC